MRILHISDCQGDLSIFDRACLNDSDIIISTGDFLPNILHDGTNSGSKDDDIRYQLKFLENNKDRIIRSLRNRIMIYVQGNHDWINFDSLNSHLMYELNNSQMIYRKEDKIYKLYGFPNTPIMRQWNHYTITDEFKNIIDKIPVDTDILITHCPPKNILDSTNKSDHEGIINLLDKIKQTKIKSHLFGHIHENNGTAIIDNVIYSNASRNHRIIDII